MLLKSGADVNIRDEIDETALHIACRHGNLKLVQLFLESSSLPLCQSSVSYSGSGLCRYLT